MGSELAGLHAVVTGGGRGIGRAVALRLAAHGARVTALARSGDQLAAVAAEAAGLAGEVCPLPADVTDDAALVEALRVATAARGPVDILVNCAGYAPPRTAVAKMAIDDLDRTLATCLRAPMALARLVLPTMLQRRRGCIINIVSVAARLPAAGEAPYAAAKAGLLAFSRALFAEVRDCGIKVSAISPGLVDTAFVPANKRIDRSAFLQPDDVADAVLHILRAPLHLSLSEVVLDPQRDPLTRRAPVSKA